MSRPFGTMVRSASESTAVLPRGPLRTWATQPETRRLALVAWGAGLAIQIIVVGVPLDRLGVMAWTAGGLAAASIGRRPLWTVLVDWAPFAAVLIVYDRIGSVADKLGMPVMWKQPADIDRAMFGTVPTVWLQNHLKLAHPPWWEGAVSLTFRKWAMRFVTMSFLGLACFIIIPSAPPWAAASCRPVDLSDHVTTPSCMNYSAEYAFSSGLLGSLHPNDSAANPWVERLSTRGWQVLHLPIAQQMLDKGQSGVDRVAAVPSLHAGCTLLVVIFAWTRVRKRWRPLLVGYALMMAFSLVYTAEHYVVDVLAGWLLAVLVSVGFARRERRERRDAMARGARHPIAELERTADLVPG
jgi:membrane-associated phospholipid phosphatase